MIQYIIPLIESYFTSEIVSFWFLPLLCAAIVATIPYIIRGLVRVR